MRTELDHIGTTREPEASALQPHTADDRRILPAHLPRQIGVLVEQPPFGGQTILRPCLLQVNERPLSGAERQMLQATDGQSIVKRSSRFLGRTQSGAPFQKVSHPTQAYRLETNAIEDATAFPQIKSRRLLPA